MRNTRDATDLAVDPMNAEHSSVDDIFEACTFSAPTGIEQPRVGMVERVELSSRSNPGAKMPTTGIAHWVMYAQQYGRLLGGLLRAWLNCHPQATHARRTGIRLYASCDKEHKWRHPISPVYNNLQCFTLIYQDI